MFYNFFSFGFCYRLARVSHIFWMLITSESHISIILSSVRWIIVCHICLLLCGRLIIWSILIYYTLNSLFIQNLLNLESFEFVHFLIFPSSSSTWIVVNMNSDISNIYIIFFRIEYYSCPITSCHFSNFQDVVRKGKQHFALYNHVDRYCLLYVTHWHKLKYFFQE